MTAPPIDTAGLREALAIDPQDLKQFVGDLAGAIGLSREAGWGDERIAHTIVHGAILSMLAAQADALKDAATAEADDLRQRVVDLEAERAKHMRWLGLSDDMDPSQREAAEAAHEWTAQFLDQQRGRMAALTKGAADA